MDQGKFTIDRQWVTPRSLKKMIAVSQAALAFPEGVGFREIHKLANEQGFCKSEFPLERQEHGIQESVNDGYIYLCGHGSYKHTQFLMLNDESINLIIDEAFGCLKHSSINGNKSLHLKMNVYEKSPILKNYDYFDVRHVIRAFGERKGVFFAGKSGADTVSFDENVTPKGQKKVILDWFRSENKPRNRDDIAKIIRSGSVNHASFYINELIEEGSLVRIDYTHYSTPEYAFMNAPVENIFSI